MSAARLFHLFTLFNSKLGGTVGVLDIFPKLLVAAYDWIIRNSVLQIG